MSKEKPVVLLARKLFKHGVRNDTVGFGLWKRPETVHKPPNVIAAYFTAPTSNAEKIRDLINSHALTLKKPEKFEFMEPVSTPLETYNPGIWITSQEALNHANLLVKELERLEQQPGKVKAPRTKRTIKAQK